MSFPTDNFKSPSAVARFILVCLIGVALDLWTKGYAFAHLSLAGAAHDGKPMRVVFIPGWVHFEITTNHGAVFGLGQGQKWLFLGVSAIAIGFLSYLFATSRNQRLYQFILGMLLAGVLGNMYDRIVFGYVRDMIHALPGWRWPGTWHLGGYPGEVREVFPFIFNVADILLCVGVGLMIVYSMLMPVKRPAKADETAPATA
ncbi:MAG TPA: signal peptidase II [Tepidisphaeraceae bacterium]|jgi:signal peptidase II